MTSEPRGLRAFQGLVAVGNRGSCSCLGADVPSVQLQSRVLHDREAGWSKASSFHVWGAPPADTALAAPREPTWEEKETPRPASSSLPGPAQCLALEDAGYFQATVSEF